MEALGVSIGALLQMQGFLAAVNIVSLLICAALAEPAKLQARHHQVHSMRVLGMLARTLGKS